MSKKDPFYAEDGELLSEWTLPLRKAVRDPIEGGDISEIHLREPTAGELEKIGKAGSGTGAAIDAIVIVSGKTRRTIESIGARDLKQAERYLLGFIQDGQTTGGDA